MPSRPIPRYSSYTQSGEPLPTSASPRWVETVDGKEWLLKRMEDSGAEEIIAEALAWRLGEALDLLIPPGALLTHGAQRGWLSGRLEDVRHWHPTLRARISNLDQVAGMLVLDAILGNRDRHEANILVESSADESSARVWAIDHGAAQVADPILFQQLGLAPPRPHRQSPQLPYRALAAPARTAASRLQAMEEAALRQMAEEAWGLVDQRPPPETLDLLARRCRLAVQIVDAYLTCFGDPS